MKHSGRVFYRYFLSLVALLTILVMGVWLFMLRYLSDNYSREIAQSVNQSLAQTNIALDGDVRQMFNICYLVQSDSLFQKMNADTDVTSRRQASAVIARYAAISSFSETVFCYCPGQDRIYLPSESLSPETFMEQYVFASYSLSDLKDVLSSSRGIQIWRGDKVSTPGRKSARYITLFLCVSTHPAAERVHVGFLIPEKYISRYLESVTAFADAAVLLTDSNRQPIGMWGRELSPDSQEALLEHAAEMNANMTRQQIAGASSFVSSARSSVTGWTLLSVVPESSVSSGLARERLIATLSMAVILILGNLAAFFLSRINYRPIAHLVQTAVPNQDISPRTDELSAVASQLEQITKQRATLHERLEKHAGARLHVLCGELLHGWKDEAELLRTAQDCGISLTGSTFQVSALYLHCKLTGLPTAEQVRKVLAPFRENDAPLLIYDNDSDVHRMTLILFQPGEEAEMLYVPMREALEAAFGAEVAIGVSSVCADYNALPQGYKEACIALDMRMVRGNSSVSLYDEADFADDILQYYPTRELERLQWQILQLNDADAAAVVDEIIQLMRDEHMSVPCVRIICYDIINTIVRSFSTLSSDGRFQVSAMAMEELVSFNTMDEFTDMLRSLTADTCASIRKMRSQSQDQRIQAILQYIQANYASPAFSIDLLADHFGLSVSNMSHYFKSNTGKTLSEYVQELRFSESCRLLQDTDMPVQDICAQIGMLNVSSFIRRFKQIYGVTPGVYRETSHMNTGAKK